MCLSAEEPVTSLTVRIRIPEASVTFPEKERLKVSRSNLPKAFWATARNIWAVARSAWAKAQCYQFKS
jgi:hypothetical protein